MNNDLQRLYHRKLKIDPFFTPRKILGLQVGMYGVSKVRRRTNSILKAVGLTDKSYTYPHTLSRGMRRRLLVAKAMVHSSPILILEEPSAGVDLDLRH